MRTIGVDTLALSGGGQAVRNAILARLVKQFT
jgi:hypothetical protein